MISQDVHVLYSVDMSSIESNTAHAQGVSEQSELTPCIKHYDIVVYFDSNRYLYRLYVVRNSWNIYSWYFSIILLIVIIC